MNLVATVKSDTNPAFLRSTSGYNGVVTGMSISPCLVFPQGSLVTGVGLVAIAGSNPTRYTAAVYCLPPPVSAAIEYTFILTEKLDFFLTSFFVTRCDPIVNVGGVRALDVVFQAGFSSGAIAVSALKGAVKFFTADFISIVNGKAIAITNRVVNLSAAFSSESKSRSRASGFVVSFNVNNSSSAIGFSNLSGRVHSFTSSFFSYVKTSAKAKGIQSDRFLTLTDVVDEVLNLWGIESRCNAPDFAIARALSDVNAAMQTVWNQADEQDYWTKSTIISSFEINETSKTLGIDIQNVVGPCRLSSNKRQLSIVRNISELENFMDIFMDGQTSDEPIAYFVERSTQSGDDPVKIVLHVTPAPSEITSIHLDVVMESPRFIETDLTLDPVIPIPHRYTESLFLPIVRYKASSFWLFENHEAKPSIDRDYQMAMDAIGTADPLPGKPIETKSEK